MFSPTLTRRYTPPTCSLEIVAKTSALSQWSGNPVIKELRFELRLDDPRLVADQKVLLSGDRQQLEDLVEAVTDYVQNFLQQTNPVFDFAPTQNIYTYQTPTPANVTTIARPQLETKGLLSHRLHLGRLASSSSGQTIQLSATQLYDLANALESYSADMVALPNLTAARNRKNVIRWGAIAASFLVVIGVSKMAFDFQQSPQLETAANLDSASAPAEAGSLQQVIPPDPHASYTFAPIPEADEGILTAEKADTTAVNLDAIAAKQAAQESESKTTEGNNPPTDIAEEAPGEAADAEIDVIASAPPAPTPVPSIAFSDPGISGTVRNAPTTRSSSSFDSYAVNAQEDLAVAPQRRGDRLSQTQQYFDANWQTPEGLRETLEYRLNVDASGNLTQVIPLGKAAELYQNRLSFLATGETIVGATAEPLQTIRLVLDPDGTVQTFAE